MAWVVGMKENGRREKCGEQKALRSSKWPRIHSEGRGNKRGF